MALKIKSGKKAGIAIVFQWENICDEVIRFTHNDQKLGGKMKLEVEDNKFVTYLMLGMMALGFVVMLLV